MEIVTRYPYYPDSNGISRGEFALTEEMTLEHFAILVSTSKIRGCMRQIDIEDAVTHLPLAKWSTRTYSWDYAASVFARDMLIASRGYCSCSLANDTITYYVTIALECKWERKKVASDEEDWSLTDIADSMSFGDIDSLDDDEIGIPALVYGKKSVSANDTPPSKERTYSFEEVMEGLRICSSNVCTDCPFDNDCCKLTKLAADIIREQSAKLSCITKAANGLIDVIKDLND
jgi:hypothetical protein